MAYIADFFWEFLGRFQSDDNNKSDNNNNDNKSVDNDSNNHKDTSFHSFQLTRVTTKTLTPIIFKLNGQKKLWEFLGRFQSNEYDKSENNNNDNKNNIFSPTTDILLSTMS